MDAARLGAMLEGMRDERKRCLKIIRAWQKPYYARFHAGEMTAQEIRTLQAVLKAIALEIECKSLIRSKRGDE